jgi:ABC-type dipeptide/oligopeptide/nickel transport system permease subunit
MRPAASAPAARASCSPSCCPTSSRRSSSTPRLLIPTNILFEAALSFLGVGIRPPTPSWGGMLSDATHWFQIAPNFMVFPGLAIFVTVLAFNLFGDGLRDALDPRSR